MAQRITARLLQSKTPGVFNDSIVPGLRFIIAARTRIVEGAVGMVEMALESLKEKGVVDLDEERRAAMVSNLLVVLCSDRATQPVVNTGSIY